MNTRNTRPTKPKKKTSDLRKKIDALEKLVIETDEEYLDLKQQVEKLQKLVRTQSQVILEMGGRLQVVEGVVPRWRRENGDEVVIRDMTDAHLKNAILKCMRGGYDIASDRMRMLKDLCAEADKRRMDWKSWGPSTEPVQRFATKD